MHQHPSSHADGVSYLLDPSYYSSHMSYQPRVYIDRKGNMHDPDYRHFPVLSSISSSSSNSPITPDDDDADYIDPFSYHAPRRSSSLLRATTPYYPSSSVSSSPSSYEASPFDDEPSEKVQGNAVKKALRRRRDRRRASLDSYVEDIQEEEQYVVERVEEEVQDDDALEALEEKEDHGAPSCGEALKRQWQSISLSMNFRIFRARRRLKRVLSK
ncbi:hypothetical protein CPB85DRAFT_1316949 [Mucidula mucida]|nr:hypothetical protein CPB85DRAFT_1316949 [Mucidula mucida]